MVFIDVDTFYGGRHVLCLIPLCFWKCTRPTNGLGCWCPSCIRLAVCIGRDNVLQDVRFFVAKWDTEIDVGYTTFVSGWGHRRFYPVDFRSEYLPSDPIYVVSLV